MNADERESLSVGKAFNTQVGHDKGQEWQVNHSLLALIGVHSRLHPDQVAGALCAQEQTGQNLHDDHASSA